MVAAKSAPRGGMGSREAAAHDRCICNLGRFASGYWVLAHTLVRRTHARLSLAPCGLVQFPLQGMICNCFDVLTQRGDPVWLWYWFLFQESAICLFLFHRLSSSSSLTCAFPYARVVQSITSSHARAMLMAWLSWRRWRRPVSLVLGPSCVFCFLTLLSWASHCVLQRCLCP